VASRCQLTIPLSTGVVDVVENDRGEPEAHVVNPRLDTMSREVYRHDDLKDLVELQRIRNHFICKLGATVRCPEWVLRRAFCVGLHATVEPVCDRGCLQSRLSLLEPCRRTCWW